MSYPSSTPPPLTLWSELPKSYHHRLLNYQMLEYPGYVIEEIVTDKRKKTSKRSKVVYNKDYVRHYLLTRVIGTLRLNGWDDLIALIEKFKER